MAPDLKYPHIEKPDGEPARLESTPRVRVAMIVMDYVFHGWSVDEMCLQHPYLMPAEAHAAMAYYFDHKDEIDREIEDEIKEDTKIRTQSRSSPIMEKLKEKGLI